MNNIFWSYAMPLTKLDVFLLSLHGKKMFLVLLLWLNGKMLISCVKTIASINSYCQNEFIDILLDSIWKNSKFVRWIFSPWARNDSHVDYDLIYEDIVKTITSMDSYCQAKSIDVLLDSIWKNSKFDFFYPKKIRFFVAYDLI